MSTVFRTIDNCKGSIVNYIIASRFTFFKEKVICALTKTMIGEIGVSVANKMYLYNYRVRLLSLVYFL